MHHTLHRFCSATVHHVQHSTTNRNKHGRQSLLARAFPAALLSNQTARAARHAPERLVERIGVDDVHLLRQGGRVRQTERVRLQRLVFNILQTKTQNDNYHKKHEDGVHHFVVLQFKNSKITVHTPKTPKTSTVPVRGRGEGGKQG